ncbi:uncharacterized protein L969DRAFT_18564 [Mixia osmundae IAM 14324]|uniref:Arrestin-like N-terminal domain-containing protein n=1 Tax=Mixia osmundae (strain CBS 9802 / IAM 14324 / JCM 22182 / KY 12970) TaxID=764103 RepID=G7E7Z3_MIXOS|nr:uncharacterized protein L969DRAFT_18564 [Mixia osmundae IAM 14324]KEI38552.1 hypothetical protein L969DRAFT_18564 [Mixia osmundae IAM 14324]GAA98953.1 hypothetical protein E5Q_05641 [Mixia osmundae IAM 14324]
MTVAQKMFFDSARIKLSLSPPLVYLLPSDPVVQIVEQRPVEETLLRGQVSVYLPKARELTLDVTFTHDIELYPPGCATERATVFEETLQVVKNQFHVKGEHTYDFVFILPPHLPSYGRDEYCRIKSDCKAVAHHLGTLGMDLVAQQRPILVVNPSGLGEPPPGLKISVDDFLDELGPYSIYLNTDHFIVSGLLLFYLDMPDPPADVPLKSIGLYIDQYTTLTSLKHFTLAPVEGVHPVINCPVQRRQLLLLDGSEHKRNCDDAESVPIPLTATRQSPANKTTANCPAGDQFVCHLMQAVNRHGIPAVRKSMARDPDHVPIFDRDLDELTDAMKRRLASHGGLTFLRQGRPFSARHLVRLPSEYALRPTTHAGTKTPIHVRHEIAVEIRYVNAQGKPRVLKINKEISLASCACMVESLVLPMYSPNDPGEAAKIDYTDCMHNCACGRSFVKMVDDKADWVYQEMSSCDTSDGNDDTPDPDAVKLA